MKYLIYGCKFVSGWVNMHTIHELIDLKLRLIRIMFKLRATELKQLSRYEMVIEFGKFETGSILRINVICEKIFS